MARTKNIFEFTGKLGNVVGYYRKGKHCIRRAPVRKNQTATPAQAATNGKFAMVNKFVQCLYPLLTLSIPDPKKMSKSNFVMSHILKHATIGTYPNFSIIYRMVLISSGRLQPAMSVKTETVSGNIIFTWDVNSMGSGNARGDDKAILLVYCEALNECVYSINSIDRRTGVGALSAARFKGYQVQTWLGFISANGNLRSNSTYTGALFVT